jgi:TolB-like protein/DNA-binding winged helix-turn-helix (wHTH) protein
MMASKSFVFCFDDVEVREREFTLKKAGVVSTLEPKAFRALLFLLHNPQKLITKDELLQAVWGDTAVTDGSLTRCIWLVRNVLGDDTRTPRYIETVPTVGYRFIAPVEKRMEADENEAAPVAAAQNEGPVKVDRGLKTNTFSKRWMWIGATSLALILIAGVAGPVVWHRSNPPQIHSLTVVPLQNLSQDPNMEYFADGMTEELIRNLAELTELKVVSDSSATPVKGSPESPAEIARKLAVDAVVEGSVSQSKDKVSLDIRLYDGKSGHQLWTARFEDTTASVPALQKHIAQAIASRARVLLTPPQQARLSSAKPLDPSAYDGYLQGRYLLGKRDFDGAVKMLRRAVVLDPGYAQSWAGLAAGLAQQGLGAGPNQEPIPEAKAAAQHALELDPDNGEAWSVLGQITYVNEWDWKEAEYDLQKGVALSPSDSTLELDYATFLALAGRGDEGVSQMRRALELDPLSFLNVRHMGTILYWTRHYDESLDYLRKAHEMEPELKGFTQGWMVKDYEMKGLHDEAVMSDLWFFSPPGASGPALQELPHLLAAYHRGGPEAYWQEESKFYDSFNQKVHPPCHGISSASPELYAGEKENALENIKRSLDEGCAGVAFTWLRADPIYDAIRGDLRFTEILKRVNLAE